MNIYISKEEKENLEEQKLLSVKVGSQLYNLNNKSSDEDILNIYAAREEDLHSLVNMHHQFQYKGDNTDFLYCSLQLFIQNILSGDSTLNFESLYSEEFKNSKELSWLYNMRGEFINYTMIKAYVGFARRDIKQYKKEKNHKKLFHALRGVKVAKAMLEGKGYSNDYQSLGSDVFSELVALKNGADRDYKYADNILEEISSARDELNRQLETKLISRSVSLEVLKELDTQVKNTSKAFMKQGQSYNDTVLKSYLETNCDPNKLLG